MPQEINNDLFFFYEQVNENKDLLKKHLHHLFTTVASTQWTLIVASLRSDAADAVKNDWFKLKTSPKLVISDTEGGRRRLCCLRSWRWGWAVCRGLVAVLLICLIVKYGISLSLHVSGVMCVFEAMLTHARRAAAFQVPGWAGRPGTSPRNRSPCLHLGRPRSFHSLHPALGSQYASDTHLSNSSNIIVFRAVWATCT